MLQNNKYRDSTFIQNKNIISYKENELEKNEYKFSKSQLACISVQFPLKKPYGHIFQRKKEDFELTIFANHKFGLPYGIEIKLFIASIVNEIMITNSPILNIF